MSFSSTANAWTPNRLTSVPTSDDPTTSEVAHSANDAPDLSLLRVANFSEQATLFRTLLPLIDTVGTDSNIDNVYKSLVDLCVNLVEGVEVSMSIADADGILHVVAGSCERKSVLEQYQLDNSDGPTVDVYRAGQLVIADLLDVDIRRWPLFSPLARAVGYRTIASMPMRLREETIGVLSVAEPVDLPDRAMPTQMLQSFADCATVGILHHRAIASLTTLSEQLEGALRTRILIEQAKGIISVRAAVSVDEAFEILRRYARGYSRKVAEVSLSIVSGTLPIEELRAPRTKYRYRPMNGSR